MNVVAVVLARLDSTRLPQKALREVGGKALIDYAFDCAAASSASSFCLATTDRSVDDPLVAHAERRGVRVFRGSTDDVAGRFLGAVKAAGADAGLRLNGDSPLHRHELLTQGIERWRATRADIVTNVPGRTWPFGWSVEVVDVGAMERAWNRMSDAGHREHVTKHFYDHASDYRVEQLPPGPAGGAGLQLAVDDEADLNRFSYVVSHCPGALADASPAALIELARSWRPDVNV